MQNEIAYQTFSLTPALSRWEREHLPQSHSMSYDWICRKLFRESRSVRSLFPRPGGESQGEGGPNIIFFGLP